MENLCRLCGNEHEFMLSVFDDVCGNRRISSKIMKVLHLKVDVKDALPKKICAVCHQRLDDVSAFINFCHNTQRRLEELCCDADQNLSFVKHTEQITRGANCSILPSLVLLPEHTNNEICPLQGDAGAELHRLALGSNNKEKVRENESRALANAKEHVIPDINFETNNLNAGGNLQSGKVESTEATMAKKITRNDTSKVGDDTNKLKTSGEPPSHMLKTSKRIQTDRVVRKIGVKKKKKKICPNLGDFDHLSGVELVREKKEWVCDTCQMTFVQESLYIEHLNVHSGNRPYSCRLCSNSFRKRQELNQHIRTVHSEKQYKCTMCNYIAKHRSKLTEHATNMHEKPFTCNLCTYRTGEKGKIHQHIANKHNGELSYVCEICGSGFRTRPSLQAHRMNVHFPEPKMCQKCGIVCPSLAKYSAHIFRCGKEKERYACEKCKKSYVSKELLKDHMNKHLNIKPYKCAVCDKDFHQRSRLDTQKYVHGEAIYR